MLDLILTLPLIAHSLFWSVQWDMVLAIGILTLTLFGIRAMLPKKARIVTDIFVLAPLFAFLLHTVCV